LEVSGLGLNVIDNGPLEIRNDQVETFSEDFILKTTNSTENQGLVTRIDLKKVRKREKKLYQ